MAVLVPHFLMCTFFFFLFPLQMKANTCRSFECWTPDNEDFEYRLKLLSRQNCCFLQYADAPVLQHLLFMLSAVAFPPCFYLYLYLLFYVKIIASSTSAVWIMLTWQKAEQELSNTAQHRIASAIIKQLITWQITAITVRCGQTPQWEARGSTVRWEWHWGAGAWANKSRISKIISVHKQIEAAGDREAFLGHSAKQINHLFSYAVWVAVAVISGELFVCLWSWSAEHHSMIVAPGRDFTAVRCLFFFFFSNGIVYSLNSVYLLTYYSLFFLLLAPFSVESFLLPWFPLRPFTVQSHHLTRWVVQAQYSVASPELHDRA